MYEANSLKLEFPFLHFLPCSEIAFIAWLDVKRFKQKIWIRRKMTWSALHGHFVRTNMNTYIAGSIFSLFPPIPLYFPLFLTIFPLSSISSLSLIWNFNSNFLQQSFLTTFSSQHPSRLAMKRIKGFQEKWHVK